MQAKNAIREFKEEKEEEVNTLGGILMSQRP